jgi:hypothetical protein
MSTRHFSAERTRRNGASISSGGSIAKNPTTTHKSRDVQLFGDLITLHRQDLEEVGKDIGRSKTASLIFLDERLGHLRLLELDRKRFIRFGKERALAGAGSVTVGIDLGYIKTILSHAAAVHGIVVSTEPNRSRPDRSWTSRARRKRP